MAKTTLVKLVMADRHLLMDDTHTSSKLYDIDTKLRSEERVIQNRNWRDVMKGHILAEAKLTGTFVS